MTPASKPASLKWRLLISAALVILLLIAGLFLFRGLQSLKEPPRQVSTEVRRPAVQVERMVRGPYREHITGYGKARAMRQAKVAAEVAGLIEWIAPELEAGAGVESGAALVRIDDRDLVNTADRAEAELKQFEALHAEAVVNRAGLEERLEVARSELATSRAELARVEELLEEEVASVAERDLQRRATRLLERQVLELQSTLAASQPRLDRALADLERARSTLRQAQLDLERAVVRAPYAGRILGRTAEPGAHVTPGMELFEIVDLSRIEVPVALPASRFDDVEPGHEVQVRLQEGGEVVWCGTVSRIAPAVGDQDRTYEAYVVIEGESLESSVPPGSFVVATVDGRLHQDVIAVPRVAFLKDSVFVAVPELGEQGQAVARRRTPVVLRWLPDVALVTSGLEPGDEVITTNLEQIADSSKILVTERDAPYEPGSPAGDALGEFR